MAEIVDYRMCLGFEIFIKKNNILIVRSISRKISVDEIEAAFKTIDAITKHKTTFATIFDLKNLEAITKKARVLGKQKIIALYSPRALVLGKLNHVILDKEFQKLNDSSLPIRTFMEFTPSESWVHLQMVKPFYRRRA